MNAKKYVKRKLEMLIKQFPQAHIRYEFHELSNTHLVEIIPNEVYSHNEYIAWELKFHHKFTKRFPTQHICFIPDDGLGGVENPEFTLCGEQRISATTQKATGGIGIGSVTVTCSKRPATAAALTPPERLIAPANIASVLHTLQSVPQPDYSPRYAQ
jgi:hypothetical protein